jgi:cobalamin biosynthesis protein CobD/CbiB
MSGPSARYKFARNPKAAIISAIMDQLLQKYQNPRAAWRSICTAANNHDPSEPLSLAAFALSVKTVGTGIQLDVSDCEVAFGSDADIDYDAFAEFFRR